MRNVFVHYSSVMNRDMSYNQITSISNAAFTGLGNLTSLSGSMNPLCDVFVHYSSVMNRSLHYNQITSISKGVFAGLGNLTTLFVTLICYA